MKFNVVTSQKGYLRAQKEFPKDNIMIFNYNLFGNLLSSLTTINDDNVYFKLLKLLLSFKYKNLVFIDYPNVFIQDGLRNELVEFSKTKDDFIYFNDKLDFFYSKKCPSSLKDVIQKFISIQEPTIIDNFSFFMKKGFRQIDFMKLSFYDGLKIYMEIFQEKENIILLDLKKQPFNPEAYREYVTDDDTFLLCYNADRYVPGWDYGSDFKSIAIIDFDLRYLPIKYDSIKTFKSLKTDKVYTCFFKELFNKEDVF